MMERWQPLRTAPMDGTIFLWRAPANNGVLSTVPVSAAWIVDGYRILCLLRDKEFAVHGNYCALTNGEWLSLAALDRFEAPQEEAA